MISIILDNRETKLIDVLKNIKICKSNQTKQELSVKQLELGDIHIYLDNIIIYIIERKTIGDLLSSLNDGRYKEQKLRVKSSLKNDIKYQHCQYLYLIEGYVEDYNDILKKKYYGTLISLQFRDKIQIIKTDNLNESCNFLTRLKNRLETKNDFVFIKEKTTLKSVDNQNQNQEYLNSIKSKKKNNINPQNCQILFLNVIPGISINIATKIIEKYKTIQKLIEFYKKCKTNEEQAVMLKDIQLTQKRKLGNVLSKRILEFLMC